MSQVLLATLATMAHAQDDGPIGQVGQELTGNATLVSVEEQQRLGLVTVNGDCSGTLLNRYWVLTAHHCVSVGNLLWAPLAEAGSVPVTASWAPGVSVTPTRIETYAVTAGLDVALLFLGEGDLGPVDTQLLYAGVVDTSVLLQKYGRGRQTFATAGPPPVPSTPGGPYRTATYRASVADDRHYVLPPNSSNQVGHGGDSGGADIVVQGAFELGIAGVQSTCKETAFVPGMLPLWDWAMGIRHCTSAAIYTIRSDIAARIQEDPWGASVFVGLSDGWSFGPSERWATGFCTREETCKVGDVNGDGYDDVLRFVKTDYSPRDSDVWVALSDGTQFGAPQLWSGYFCTLDETCEVADVNGDGADDLVSFVKTNHTSTDSDVWVALSYRSGFHPPEKWHDNFCTLDETCAVGDMNGDDRADVITFVGSNGGANDADVYVSLSTGDAFAPAVKWADYFCTGNQTCAIADMNGDGWDDAVLFVKSDGSAVDADVWVALSGGFGLTSAQKWKDHFCTGDQTCALGDVNGDGNADGLLFVKSDGSSVDADVWSALSDGGSLWGAEKAQDYFCILDETCAVGDVNGDGRDDVIAFVHGN